MEAGPVASLHCLTPKPSRNTKTKPITNFCSLRVSSNIPPTIAGFPRRASLSRHLRIIVFLKSRPTCQIGSEVQAGQKRFLKPSTFSSTRKITLQRNFFRSGTTADSTSLQRLLPDFTQQVLSCLTRYKCIFDRIRIFSCCTSL